MKILLSKPTIPKLFARQSGWQRALVTLFISSPNTVGKRQSIDIGTSVAAESLHASSVEVKQVDKTLSKLNRQRSNSSGTGNELDFDCIYEINDDFNMASSPQQYSPSEMFYDQYPSQRRQSSVDDFDTLVSGRGIMKAIRSASCTSTLSQVCSALFA